MIQLTLTETLDLVLHLRPWNLVSKQNPILAKIQAEPDYQNIAVVEDDPATIGMDGRPLGEVGPGYVRLWYRKDWELCDNKRRQAVLNIERSHKEHAARMIENRKAIKAYLLKNQPALQPSIVDMLVDGLKENEVVGFLAKFQTMGLQK